MRRLFLTLLLFALTGCSDSQSQPEFPDLLPVEGTVYRAGKPVSGGLVQFVAVPERPEFIINSLVGNDGKFQLTTVRTTDSDGERQPGVAAGTYRVTYFPDVADQTISNLDPIELPKPVTIDAPQPELKIEF